MPEMRTVEVARRRVSGVAPVSGVFGITKSRMVTVGVGSTGGSGSGSGSTGGVGSGVKVEREISNDS